MTNQPNIPDRLEASIGNMLGYYSVQLEGTKISYMFCKRSEPTQTLDFTPTQEDWDKFNFQLKEANVWAWETAYIEPQLADGNQWHLRIEQGGREKIIEGSNRYPSPEQFAKYLDAIRILIGNNYFQ